ncbi:hypothetical protein GCM10007856_29600 [Azospirillum oryzae]|nr:hypothetical protein GCM10007856_29600 [Azospirillum oryzae]
MGYARTLSPSCAERGHHGGKRRPRISTAAADRSRRLEGALIDLALGKLGQLLIRRLFLAEGLIKQLGDIRHPARLRQR